MEIIEINKIIPEINTIIKTAKVIKNGGVVIFPCDTSYGLAVDFLNPIAIEKIFKIKKRLSDKKLSVIIKDENILSNFCDISNETKLIIKKYLPGQITFILKLQKIINNSDTIGIRIPNTPITNGLSNYLDNPYTATSANPSGQPPAHNTNEILRYFNNAKYQPDLFLNAGTLDKLPPSTIVDLTQTPPKILRNGSKIFKSLFSNYSRSESE